MHESILKFLNYTVDVLRYEHHDCNVPEGKIEIKQSITKCIQMHEDGFFDAMLSFKTIQQEGISYPFDIEVQVTGHFQIQSDNTCDSSDAIINQNSYAILFPYLRAIITNLTGTANIPPIILPIMNLTSQ